MSGSEKKQEDLNGNVREIKVPALPQLEAMTPDDRLQTEVHEIHEILRRAVEPTSDSTVPIFIDCSSESENSDYEFSTTESESELSDDTSNADLQEVTQVATEEHDEELEEFASPEQIRFREEQHQLLMAVQARNTTLVIRQDGDSESESDADIPEHCPIL